MPEPTPTPDWAADDLQCLGSCPICDEPQRDLLHEGLGDRLFRVAPGRWRLWRCSSCRSAYLDPRPTRESIGAAYRRYFPLGAEEPPAPLQRSARLRKSLSNGYLNRRYGYSLQPATRLGAAVLPLFPKRRWNAALTVRGLPKPAGRPRLLDVGFGDASFLRFMSSAGWDTAGLEVDEEAVVAARTVGLDVASGPVEDAPFGDETFDAITLSHVIEHLHDPIGSLRRCFGLLRRNGVLWLATPNLDSPGHQRFGRDWFGLDPPRHLVLFHPGGIDHALREAGFIEISHLRTYRAELVLAGSEALATGRDAATAVTPVSPKLRRAARLFDLAAGLHPRFGEELVALARRPR